MSIRRVAPEILDDLDPGDPLAKGSRRDLRRLNLIMGHRGFFARILRESHDRGLVASGRLIELGSGDGWFLSKVLVGLPAGWIDGANLCCQLVDRHPSVTDETRRRYEALGVKLDVVEADVFEWLPSDRNPSDAVLANLFLHHFDQDRLSELLGLVAGGRSRFFAACEPRRSRMALLGARCVGGIGCNRVTRHDAVVSVRAGFRDRELSALWPKDEGWSLEERRFGLFSHEFVARRPMGEDGTQAGVRLGGG